MAAYTEVERIALETAEVERITGCIADRLAHVYSSRRVACDMLVREIAFLAVTQRELRVIISQGGPVRTGTLPV